MAVQPITAGGGVLFRQEDDQPEVLLIFRRGVWDLPKGKKERGETTEQCAVREVAEEVGCSLPESLSKLVETYHEYSQEGVTLGKVTHWFAMKAGAEETYHPQKEEGIKKVEWFSLERAKQVVGYDNLLIVLNSFEQWLHTQTGNTK